MINVNCPFCMAASFPPPPPSPELACCCLWSGKEYNSLSIVRQVISFPTWRGRRHQVPTRSKFLSLPQIPEGHSEFNYIWHLGNMWSKSQHIVFFGGVWGVIVLMPQSNGRRTFRKGHTYFPSDVFWKYSGIKGFAEEERASYCTFDFQQASLLHPVGRV